MPEYLSPGVYVEEVSTGSKPIEGVSTSTSGMVGVTERGPEDVPVLLTSNGEFRRIFGGELNIADFSDTTERVHAYFPHSVQGFFQNGGRRNYAVRVLPDAATHASRFLFDRGDETSVEATLLRTASQGSGTAVNLPLLYALLPAGYVAGDLVAGDTLRIGDGSRAEYHTLAANPTVASSHVSLGSPLGDSYPAGTEIYPVDPAAIANEYDATYSPFTLNAVNGVDTGTLSLNLTEGAAGDAATLETASLVAGANIILEVGAVGTAEYIRIESITATGTNAEITLASPLIGEQINGATFTVVDSAALIAAAPGAIPILDVAANGGDILVYPDNNATFGVGEWAVIADTASNTVFEVRRVGELGTVDFDVDAYADYPQGTSIQQVDLVDDSETVAGVTSASVFTVGAVGNLQAGMSITIGAALALSEIQAINSTTLTLTLANPAAALPVAAELVVPTTELSADAAAGARVLSLANRIGLQNGDLLRVGVFPNEEYVTVVSVSGTRGVAPDAGTVVVSPGLAAAMNSGIRVVHLAAPTATAGQQATVLVLAGDSASHQVMVSDQSSFAALDILRIAASGGSATYHRVTASAAVNTEATLSLTDALAFSHEAGADLLQRESLMEVQALDRGAWGNRLQVAVEDTDTSLVQAELSNINPPLVLSLSNYTGVEAGTVLELLDPNTREVIDDPLKVVSVDRASGEVLLDGTGLSAAHIAAHAAAVDNLLVRSREFALNVFLLQAPDPAVPSRNTRVIDSESFVVTMDPRHSRYIHDVIGTTWSPLNDDDDDGNPLRRWDRRSEGESSYIRVRDVAAGNTAVSESVRLGPEDLDDVLDSGAVQAARLPLSEGDDAITTLVSTAQGDSMYLGVSSDEPEDRTGIHALRNIPDISIVAVPGQTTTAVQQGLINHCELDRYRFAVLDARGPRDDTLIDVQTQRQRFDTKYAALYHPWLTIQEPLPTNPANNSLRFIPPSGHVIGIYARTDNSRGVHKAPANEVVRGILGLTRSLNKREHDILNPFPKNINVIRDFRESNRGLRVWGGRCITSDSDYKYVNVRRLMIFLEASMDRGLQWVVFEPNAEALWARVRRSITNFLNVVWRNGALEGSTAEQAFFVKCDRTTMTQTDIDNGRLICEIGVAPVKPAEFVIVRIGLWTASAD